MAPKSKTKAKAEEIEEELDDDTELEDLDEDEVEAKPKKGRSADDEVTFGVRQLCDLVKKKTGKEYSPKEMRTLLRKMARETEREGGPRIDREIVRGNKARYDWSGPDHPEVKRVLKAVSKGEIEQARKETLDELKAKKAKKDASEGKSKTKSKKKGKAAKAPAEDEDLEEIEDFDEEDAE